MILAVGSTRGPKVEAVRRVLAQLADRANVTDGRRGAHGCGGAIEVPRALLDRVVSDGVELAEAVDAFARENDVRSRQGAWGVLSGGLFDRTRSFEIALINAFAPFYNDTSYE